MKIVITFKTFPEQKKLMKQFSENGVETVFLEDSPKEMIADIVSTADILLSWNPEKEGLYDLAMSCKNVKFMQLLSAGYDHINLDRFPDSMKIAANQGAYAEPMAEHALAMILALSKRLPIYHNHLSDGIFNQLKSTTKSMRGSVLGIIGFGSIGKATANLMKPFGVRVFAINTTGKTNEEVEFIGTLNNLDFVLKNADSLLISCPLNEQTNNLINKQKLDLMKPNAVLVNVARGQIINEKDLYEHLKTHPDFYAGIDAWWVEPFKYGKFELHFPFFELPNILGSPHNSAMVEDAIIIGTEKAIDNVKLFIRGEKVNGLIH
jgi:lactate dehydrogenase-like 2-hydroxyacid dehydrogenase